jgi:hypothetical protein
VVPVRRTTLVLLFAVACVGDSPAPAPVDAGRDARSFDAFTVEGGVPFIAAASDFNGFHSWYSVYITTDIAPGDSHINGPRHVFINHLPPKGSTQFPIGTIIVKETDPPGPVTGRTVFASVKRGGDYDPTGDVNWEWFSLQNKPDGTETVLWRGPGPASGGAYGNAALGGCNACHGVAKKTDYVLTEQLELMITPPKG